MIVTDIWALFQEFFVVVIGPVLIIGFILGVVMAIGTGVILFIHLRTQ